MKVTIKPPIYSSGGTGLSPKIYVSCVLNEYKDMIACFWGFSEEEAAKRALACKESLEKEIP